MPEISAVADTLAVSKTIFDVLRYVKSVIGSEVISAYFRYDGTRVEGSPKIEIELNSDESGGKAIWYYNVKPITDYVFVRYPLIES